MALDRFDEFSCGIFRFPVVAGREQRRNTAGLGARARGGKDLRTTVSPLQFIYGYDTHLFPGSCMLERK
jgi:hypothetical protein